MKIVNPKLEIPRFFNLNRKSDEALFRRKFGKEAYIEVPCGKCAACVEKKSNDWASRIYHEWLYAPTSAFLTLTYADEHLTYNNVVLKYGHYIEPVGLIPVLVKEDVQKFMKRLRKKLGNGLRFFLGAEYGETDGRPHYHLALFGYPQRFHDNILEIVKETWAKGNIQYGDMNIRRIMYVAKYIYSTSLINHKAENFVKPFILCSRMPGLGYQYYLDKKVRDYHNTTLDTNVPIDDNKKLPMPRYYRDKIFTEDSKDQLYRNWIDNPPEKPKPFEVELFLKRFSKKKRGKSI